MGEKGGWVWGLETVDKFLICPVLRSSTLNYAQVAWKIVGRDSQISNRPLEPSRLDDVYAKLLCTLFTRGRTGEPMQIAFNETQLFNFTGSVTVPTWPGQHGLHVAYYIILCL